MGAGWGGVGGGDGWLELGWAGLVSCELLRELIADGWPGSSALWSHYAVMGSAGGLGFCGCACVVWRPGRETRPTELAHSAGRHYCPPALCPPPCCLLHPCVGSLSSKWCCPCAL